MSEKVIFTGILEGVATRKDKTLSLKIGTQEMPASKAAEIMAFNQQYISVLVRADNVTKDDLKALDEVEIDLYEEKTAKTPSQRLRAVMYVLWEQEGKKGDFKSFYAAKMDRIIEHFKEKLK